MKIGVYIIAGILHSMFIMLIFILYRIIRGYNGPIKAAHPGQIEDHADIEYYEYLEEVINWDEVLPERLTGAVTLASVCHESVTDVPVPKPGYEKQLIVEEGGALIDTVTVSVPAERIWEVFDDLLNALADTVEVVLVVIDEVDETVDHIAHDMDLAVVRSVLFDHQDLLVKDGQVGIFLGSESHGAVQLTDDKDILIHAEDATPFLEILHRNGIEESMPVFVSQVPHYHISDPDAGDRIESLKSALGIQESVVRIPEIDEVM